MEALVEGNFDLRRMTCVFGVIHVFIKVGDTGRWVIFSGHRQYFEIVYITQCHCHNSLST